MATVDSLGFVRFQDSGSATSTYSEIKSGRPRPAFLTRPLESSRPADTPVDQPAGSTDRRAEAEPAAPAAEPAAPAAEEKPAPPKKNVDTSAEAAVSRLLHAIALKEAATARLIHAEAEKAERASRAAVGALSFEDVLALHRSAADIMYAIARKEELLVSKLSVLLAIVETMAGVRKGDQDEDLEPEQAAFLFTSTAEPDDDSA